MKTKWNIFKNQVNQAQWTQMDFYSSCKPIFGWLDISQETQLAMWVLLIHSCNMFILYGIFQHIHFFFTLPYLSAQKKWHTNLPYNSYFFTLNTLVRKLVFELFTGIIFIFKMYSYVVKFVPVLCPWFLCFPKSTFSVFTSKSSLQILSESKCRPLIAKV